MPTYRNNRFSQITSKAEERGGKMNGFPIFEYLSEKTLKIQFHSRAGKIERAGVPLGH